MTTFNCSQCNSSMELDMGYNNVEEADVNCEKCGAVMTVKIQNGSLKKIVLKYSTKFHQ